MMTNPAVDVSTISRIEHDEAMRITVVEFDRALALFRSLDAGDWAQALQLLHRVPPDDLAKDFLTVFIAQHNRTPPAEWDGVVTLGTT